MMKKNLLIFIVLVWSIALVAEQPPAKQLSPYTLAVDAYRAGRYAEVEQWYQSLSKRDKHQPEYLRLATLTAIADYRTEQAEARLEVYEGLRLKGTLVEERAEVVAYQERVERLLSNAREVVTLDTLRASRGEVEQRLKKESHYLGEVSEAYYISPDGKSRWQVTYGVDSVPYFLLYHQLGDGRWDEGAPERVEMMGLPEGSRVSYPFVGSDGSTLYFSLEERNKGSVPRHVLGGRDIYVSRYDREQGALLVPTQLMLPFNSPMDDLCYIVDEERDLGWLVSNRGCVGDSLRLWTFAPSTLHRYEGEKLREVAMWCSPILQHREGGQRLAPQEMKGRVHEEAPLFWMGDEAVYRSTLRSASLPNGLVEEYLKVAELLEGSEATLAQLRRELGERGSSTIEGGLKERLLSGEAECEQYRERLRMLRNEVIRHWRGER